MTLRKAPNATLTGAPLVVDIAKTEPDPCAVLLQNESPYTLDITIGADVHTLGAWIANVYPTPNGITQFSISPETLITVNPPSAILLITTAAAGDVIPGVFPMALSRQAASYAGQEFLGTVLQQTTKTFVLPAGTHAIGIVSITGGVATGCAVTGHQSGWTYLNEGSSGGLIAVVPILSGYDTSVDIAGSNGIGGQTGTIAVVAILDPSAVFAKQLIGAADIWTVQLNLGSGLGGTTAFPLLTDTTDRAARLLGTLSARTGTWTTTLAAVPATTTTYFTLLAANAARKGVIIGTDNVVGGNLSLVQPGAAAGAGNGMFFLTAGNYPTGTWQMQEPIATGLLQGVTLAAGMSGSVRVTEIT